MDHLDILLNLLLVHCISEIMFIIQINKDWQVH